MAGEKLRIFVAMPGSSMGEAGWTDIEEIKEALLEPVREQLARRTGREFDPVVIEKDRTSAGVIHDSMFREAIDADVYIADLTGANANVYLELGARWALRDRVKILITQRMDDRKFNVSSSRAILYGQGPSVLRKAIESIVDSAAAGLEADGGTDSPVRSSLDVVTLPRDELAALHREIARLSTQQAEDLMRQAETVDAERALELLRQAVENWPAGVEPRLRFGAALRDANRRAESATILREATRLAPGAAEAWRELGVTLSKDGDHAGAGDAFRRSLDLDDRQSEVWSNLGGLRRRMSRRDGVVTDWALLAEAEAAYAEAARIDPVNTYPRFNQAVLALCLSAHDATRRDTAMRELTQLRHLSRFAVGEDPGDQWRRFDLAETLALLGQEDEATREAADAIALVDPIDRESVLASAGEPLRDLLGLDVLDEAQERAVRAVLGAFERGVTA